MDEDVHLEQCCPEGKTTCPFKCKLRVKRKELQLHLSACEQRMRSCEIPGCHFWGDSEVMKTHEEEQAQNHIRLLKEEREKLQQVVLRGDKNTLELRTGVSIASFRWTIDGFKERVAEKMTLSQSVPLTSTDFNSDGKLWRMLMFIAPPKCKMYVQLRSAVSPVRVAVRFVIFGNYDDAVTLDSELMKEGDMIGAEFSLTELEKKAEDRIGPLVVKVFLERVHLSLK
ncbi:uncharacterized protein [Montipora capricornis]|uniref:uncharacterized protein n=1 Tax=Montipora capricornis TaxID=246305 RepID=UPI0035F14B0D